MGSGGGRLLAAPGLEPAVLLLPRTAEQTDFRADVSIVPLPDEARHARAGLLYRAVDRQHGYLAMIRSDGAYWLGHLDAGRITPSLSGRVATVRQGESNTLTVICEGPRQIVMVNGQRLLERRDERYARGAVGLVADGPGRSAFDDFHLGEPSEAAPPRVVPPEPTPPAPPGTPPPVTPVEPTPVEPTPVMPTPVTPTPDTPTVVTPAPVLPPLDGPRVDPGPSPSGESGATAPTLPAGRPVLGPALTATPPVAARPEATPVAPVAARPEATPVAPGPAAGAVLFEETFGERPQHTWRQDDARRIADGQIVIQAREGYLLSGFPLDLRDYRYQARARSLSETGGTYGLVVRLQPGGDSGYLCVVREPDVFAVARLDRGQATLLGRGRVTLGADWHELAVDAAGGNFTFLVDGEEVSGFADSTYPSGGIGLWVDDYRSAAFDDLLVTALGAAPAGPPPEPERELLFEERFDPPQLAWRQDRQRMIREGAFELRSPEELFITAGVPESRTGNYRYEADVQRLEGPDRGLCGVIARLQPDSRSGFVFALRGSGQFVVFRMDRAGAKLLAEGAAPLRERQNHLRIDCDGDALEFRLNGTLVAEARDDTYLTGGFGLYADNGVIARFDNLRATRDGISR